MSLEITVNHITSQSYQKLICHVTTVHPRNDTRILFKECRSLVNAGYNVHFIVGDGKGESVIEGIQIHDIGPKPESRIKRILVQPKRVEKKIFELKPEVIHIHDPELLPVGIKLAKKGMHVIYDVHEDVPRQVLTKHWIPTGIRPFIANLFEYYENHAVRSLFGVVAATPHIEKRFSGHGIRTVGVNNYPLPEELAPFEGGLFRQNRVCYVGVISRMRGVLQVVQALPLVPDVRLTLCGDIAEPCLEEDLRSTPGWSQVDYLGIVDRKTVRRVMAESFAGIVTFLPAPNHVDAQPNKLFEYMSSELPVIASNFPLWKEIIYGAGCGVCVNPHSPEDIAEAIRKICYIPDEIKRMGRAGRQAVLSRYNWEIEAKKLIVFYRSMI